MLAQATSAGTPLNPLKLHDTIAAISPYVLTDSGLNSVYIAKMAIQLRSLKTPDVEYFTVPTDGTGMEGDQSVVFLDDGVAEIAQDLKNDRLDQYQPCRVTVCP